MWRGSLGTRKKATAQEAWSILGNLLFSDSPQPTLQKRGHLETKVPGFLKPTHLLKSFLWAFSLGYRWAKWNVG